MKTAEGVGASAGTGIGGAIGFVGGVLYRELG